jgi:pimeloyl-ACP methyl ester carboxylesterase
MRRLVRILLVAVPILAVIVGYGVYYAIENVLPYSPIRPHRVTALEMARYSPDLLSPAAFASKWEEFDITVEDTIRLKGWFVFGSGDRHRGTIVLLHGIASTRIAMLSVAKTFVQNGFNCILYDARANGESGGINCTFGYFEKRDLSAYLDSASVRYPGCGPFGVFGNSFGAATAIQALASEKRLRCGIAESPFATLREVIHDYFRQMFYVPLDFIPDAALVNTERIAGFRVDDVTPEADARRITQPTMIIHGALDHKVSPHYGRRVFDNLASEHKEWYLIDRAGHDDVAAGGGAEYEHRILDFFGRFLVY